MPKRPAPTADHGTRLGHWTASYRRCRNPDRHDPEDHHEDDGLPRFGAVSAAILNSGQFRSAQRTCGRLNARQTGPRRLVSACPCDAKKRKDPRCSTRGAPRVPHAARWRGGVVARGACAAARDAGRRIRQCWIIRCAPCRRVPQGPQRNRFCRGPECEGRVPLAGREIRSAAGAHGRSG